MGDEFKVDEARDCIVDWMTNVKPTAAYSAFAVPYCAHARAVGGCNELSNAVQVHCKEQ